MDSPTTRVQRALSDLTAGRPIIVTGTDAADDAHLVLAGDKASVASVAFMVRYGSGLVCAALTGEDCNRLGIVPMVGADRDHSGIEYMVSVDAVAPGTGISAADRALTLRRLADSASKPGTFSRPGHVLGVRAADGGTLTKATVCEAAVDLVVTAGVGRVGAFSALVSETESAEIASSEEAIQFADTHGLGWVSIHDIMTYRRINELHISTEFTVTHRTEPATIKCTGYRSTITGVEYIAYTVPMNAQTVPLVSVVLDNDPIPHLAESNSALDAIGHVTANGGGTVLVVRSRADVSADPGIHHDLADIVRECGYHTVELVNFPSDTRTMLWHFGLKIHDGPNSTQNNWIDSHAPDKIVGLVVTGDQRGRELGFRTANLEMDECNTIADGVWAGRCTLPDGSMRLAAISVGRRPTFYGRSGIRLLEAHLLDFDGNLYGSSLTVELDHWMRGQTTFSSKEELVAALAADVIRTRSLLTDSSCQTT